jgi:site-specific recombinase XerC
MTYHNTKDLLYVKKILGHRSISSTMIYTHLVDFEDDGQYLVKVARDLDEYTEFLENGFEYISDYDNLKVLRKRK